MPDDVKLDDAALAEAVRAAKDEGEFCTQGYMTFPGKEIAEAAIRAYLSALPSLPSDIDGLVEELGAVGKAILYTCADCEESGNYEGMCHTADNCVLLDGRVLCEECYSDGHYPKGAPRIPDIKKGVGKLIAALRARQTPEGAVEDIKAAMSAAIWNDFLYDIDKMVYGDGSRLPDQNDAAHLADIAYRAALSAMPSGAVKVKELSWKQRGPDWYADTPVGHYAVGTYRNHFIAMVRTVDSAHMEDIRLEEQPFDTVDAAKAACQADYAARILSALEGQPS